jgi:hypothetical protein
MADRSSTEKSEIGTTELIAVWQTVAARRQSYDAMMWQTPALGMTAQAFLLSLALGSGTSALSRIISAGLSVLISVMVVQLLAKHRRNEFLDTLALEELESSPSFPRAQGFYPHAIDRYSPEKRAKADASGRGVLLGPRRFWSMSSFALWCYGQYVFALAATAIIAIVSLGGSAALS